MKVIPLNGTILDRHLADNARGKAADAKANIDYNIMMGNLEDPTEEEDENGTF